MIEMTAAECRTEALRRIEESDRLFAEYVQLPDAERGEFSLTYSQVCHLRQTAPTFAALANG